jgi:hypothetical protein
MIVRTPAWQALAAAETAARAGRPRLECKCWYEDIGIGLQKVAETPDCPYCTEFGYAAWALEHGTPPERVAARAYLDEAMTTEQLVPSEMPAATLDDLVNEEVPRYALAGPVGWMKWLADCTGRLAWAGDVQVPETNFMARAQPGETAGGYVKRAETRDGLAVWAEEAGCGPDDA